MCAVTLILFAKLLLVTNVDNTTNSNSVPDVLKLSPTEVVSLSVSVTKLLPVSSSHILPNILLKIMKFLSFELSPAYDFRTTLIVNVTQTARNVKL